MGYGDIEIVPIDDGIHTSLSSIVPSPISNGYLSSNNINITI